MRTRHMKKSVDQAGSKVRYEASLHVSNVMVLDPKTKKPTRIGYKVDPKTGQKVRIARKSGEVLVHVKGAAKAAVAKPVIRKKGEKVDVNSQTRAKEGGGTSFTTAHRSQGG
jgi:hypothetical protein